MIELQPITSQEDDGEENNGDSEEALEINSLQQDQGRHHQTQDLFYLQKTIFFCQDPSFSLLNLFVLIKISEEEIIQDVIERSVEEDYDENYLNGKSFTEILKIHFKNLRDVPKVDPITKEKITFRSALGTGFIAAIFCALRYLNL